MSFINGNTVSPVNETHIGFSHQTNPFATETYNNSSPTFLYDTYEIPKGVWLISASVWFKQPLMGGLINTICLSIAFPGDESGKNSNVLSIPSGYNAYSSSVCEPYYSDGNNRKCGIWFYGTTTNSTPFQLYGEEGSAMTYVKIA